MKFFCGVCGEKLPDDSMQTLDAHSKGHTPLQNRAGAAEVLSMFVSRVDRSITEWSNYPDGALRMLCESDDGKALVASDPKAQDMLAIRLQCSEEFIRVAKEYRELLRLRLEAGGVVEP